MAITNKVFFENVIKANLSAEMTDKAKALLATAEKKSASKAKAQTANALANLAAAKGFAALMKSGVTYAVSEIKALAKSEDSTAKISAICKVGVENGVFTVIDGYKVGGKGRAVKGYSLAVAPAEDTEDEGDSSPLDELDEDEDGETEFDFTAEDTAE